MALYDPIYGISGQPTFQMGMPQTMPMPQPAVQQPPCVKVITLAGESAAKSLKLAPGSTLLAADETEAIIWVIKANDVGPNTVHAIPFDPAILSGGSAVPTTDLTEVLDRISKMEERMTKYESAASTDKHSGNSGSGNSNNRR